MTPSEVEFWRKASADLGVEIVAPFEITLAHGNVLVVSALIKNFGPPLGMVANADFGLLSPHTAELKDSGYGYSSGFGRAPDEYNREGVIEILKDWGWSGPPDKKPAWLA